MRALVCLLPALLALVCLLPALLHCPALPNPARYSPHPSHAHTCTRSTEPGSWALLQLDTSSEVVREPPPVAEGDAAAAAGSGAEGGARGGTAATPDNELVLGYLKSYERMGKALVECVANCK